MDDIDRKVELIKQRTGRGITREAYEKFFNEYDFDGEQKRIKAEFTYEILDPEKGRKYDEEIQSYSYLIKRNNHNVIFQPHNPHGEGLNPFGSAEEAEVDAKAQIDSITTAEASQNRDADFVRSME